MSQVFTLTPRGPFELERAATFGFGPRRGEDFDGTMRLAFAVDGLREHAGVVLRQDADGTVHAGVQGVAPGSRQSVRNQVARVLSLDHDGEGWTRVGERDPVIGALQARYPRLRPVLFHSPYEAAGWGIIAARQAMRQAARVRDSISARLGRSFGLLAEPWRPFRTWGSVLLRYAGTREGLVRA